MLAKALSRNWWIALVRGVVAILFGLVAFSRPGSTLAALVVLFAGFAFIEGVLTMWSAVVARRSDEDWWVLLVEGAIGVIFGVLTFLRPDITTLALLFTIGAWAIVIGALRIATAVHLRREIKGEGWLAIGGVVSILMGLLMFFSPPTGALALLYLIGAWAVITGAMLCVFAFKLKRLDEGRQIPFSAHVPGT